MNQLLDTKAAAKLLAISEWTVRARIREGKLVPVRIGRLVRLEVSEIQAFVETAKSNGAKAPEGVQR